MFTILLNCNNKEENIQTTSITPYTFIGALKPIKILRNSKGNKNRPYLYNEIIDITKKCKIPATFYNEKIELPSPTKDVINKLKTIGIGYKTIK